MRDMMQPTLLVSDHEEDQLFVDATARELGSVLVRKATLAEAFELADAREVSAIFTDVSHLNEVTWDSVAERLAEHRNLVHCIASRDGIAGYDRIFRMAPVGHWLIRKFGN